MAKVRDLTIDDLEYLMEQKILEMVNTQLTCKQHSVFSAIEGDYGNGTDI